MEYGAVAIWLGLALVLTFAGLPLAATLFPRAADRGASLALPLVLGVVFLVTHVVGRVSLGASLLSALVVLLLLVVVAQRRGARVDLRSFGEIALVFGVAFLFLIAARALDPAIIPAGGEKFLDFGLLKAILRADAIPPEDFWFAGEPVMYYYGGHLIASQLVRLTGTPPPVAYNLALATFFASYVTAAYGLAGSVAGRGDALDRRAALLAGFFVMLAGTLFTPIRLLLRPLPADLAESIARTVGVWAGRFGEGGLITDAEPFSMWEATGVIEGTINEIPVFAFVNGDLHAHMMAPPFTLLVLGVLYAYTRTPPAERRRRLALLFGVVPAIGATLAVVNTWSVPTVVGLTALAVWYDGPSPRTILPASLHSRVASLSTGRRDVARVAVALVAAIVVAVLGVGLSLPFWLANAGGRTIALLPDRSGLAALLVVHGLFLGPISLYLSVVGWRRYGPSRRQAAGVLAGVLVALAVTAIADLAVLGLVGPILVGGYLLGRTSGPRETETDEPTAHRPGFELVPILGAAGLVLIVEFVYLAGEAGPGRFNTVFKVYAQVWALFAVGAAIALARLRHRIQTPPVPHWSTIIRGVIVLVVLLASVYPALSLGLHFGNRLAAADAASLDGTAYVDKYHADEAPAIRWLDDRAGTPPIVTAPGRAYEWSNAPSSLTGIPTLIGWQHHQVGFGRSAAAVSRRAADVETIYTGNTSAQTRLLARYSVRYVYVGPTEQATYADITIQTHPALAPVREVGAVTIYRVDPPTAAG